MTVYLKEHGPKTADGGIWVSHMADPIIDWWGSRKLSEIKAAECDRYTAFRVGQGVSDQTARHELKSMRAAINYYHANYGPLTAVPVVTLPPRKSPRQNYWLTRKQVADRIRAARRLKQCGHVIRQLLIGVYSGTRPGAVRKLSWLPSPTGGWFDLDTETLHRRGSGVGESKKRQPPCRIHRRLLPWLQRWRKADLEAKITLCVHYYGKPIKKLRRSWKQVALAAGHSGEDGPHITRHTCATWLMQSGVDQYEAAGYLGMSPETLWGVYGHHSPMFQDQAAKAGGRRR